MLISQKDLKEIETFVGYGSKAFVLVGDFHGSIAIRVSTKFPSDFNCQKSFEFQPDLNRQKIELQRFAYYYLAAYRKHFESAQHPHPPDGKKRPHS
jgi:hypothetical protein